MTAASLAAAGVAIKLLYDQTMEEERARLQSLARGQAQLIDLFEHLAEGSDIASVDVPTQSFLESLTRNHFQYQPLDAFDGDFLLFRQHGERIHVAVHGGKDAIKVGSDISEQSYIPLASNAALPMRRALAGESGVAVGVDERGVGVMTAYRPLAAAGWGLAARAELSAIRTPFLQIGVVAATVTILAALAGAVAFLRLSNPWFRRLEISERRFRDLAESASDWFWETDEKIRYTYISGRFEEVAGISVSDIIGVPREQVLARHRVQDNGQDTARARDHEAVLAARRPFRDHEVNWRRSDGKVAVYLSSGQPYFDDQGQFRGYRGVSTDITARKRAETELRKLSRAMEQSPNAVIITNIDAEIEYVNPRFTEITGFSGEEVLGQNSRILSPGGAARSQYETLWATLLAGKIWRGEIENRRKNGEIYWSRESISPIRNQADKITHYVAIKEDITEQKRIEQELRNAKEQAEFANRTKTEFLANMSHELRTPLNAIIGFSDLLIGQHFGAINGKQSDYLEDIKNSGVHLLSIINDILDLSKVEAGKLDLYEENIVIDELLESCGALVRERLNQERLTLDVDCPAGLPTLYADPRKTKQILINLLSNALKFTPPDGHITIRAHVAESGEFVMEIQDTGVGIAEDDIQKALAVFGQIDSSLARKHEGTGLGLPLVVALAEMHGGRLELDSEVGVGTTVRVFFPADRVGVDDNFGVAS